MTRPDDPDTSPAAAGTRTGTGGTPYPVDVSRDRVARVTWFVFLGGPLTWLTHFMVVYLVVEAGCSGAGPGLSLFDPPVPAAVTLAATGAGVLACMAFAVWAYRWWRASSDGPAADEADELSGGYDQRDRGGALAFAGFLLSLLSLVSILFVGLPALVLEC